LTYLLCYIRGLLHYSRRQWNKEACICGKPLHSRQG